MTEVVNNKEDQMIESIQKNINLNFFLEFLKRNWNKYQNIHIIGDLIGEFFIHHMIHKDGYLFEEYMNQIETLYNALYERKISPEVFQEKKTELIAIIISRKLGIDINDKIEKKDVQKIKDYFMQEYVNDGYVSHCFPDVYYQSIMTNGLISSTEKRQDIPKEIMEIQEIFMKKGIASPLGGYPYYGGSGIYYEHDFKKIFQHAISSPEWFVWFTSANHQKTYHSDIAISPYILRDETACRRNIEDLCINAELDDNETKKVLKFYSESYQRYSSPKLNVALISKKTLSKDKVLTEKTKDMSLKQLINYVLNDEAKQYIEHVGNVYHGTLKPELFRVVSIPEVSKYLSTPVMGYMRESKEQLTSMEANLRILERVVEFRGRLIPSMVEKIKICKQKIMEKSKKNVKENNRQLVLTRKIDRQGFVSFTILIIGILIISIWFFISLNK